MYSVRTEYRKHEKSTYFRLKVQTFVSHTSTYRYVLSTYFFAYSCTDFSSFRKGTYRVRADSGGVRTFGFLILLRARRAAQPVCLRAIQAPAHALNQVTLKHWQVYSLLLGSTLDSA
jgi:hypothetical protein